MMPVWGPLQIPLAPFCKVGVRVDLKAAINGSGTQSVIQLQPQDVVYVPKSFF